MARSSDAHGIACSLALEMAARKLTVRGLAEAAGVHPGAVSRLRAGHFQMIDCQTLERICRHLHLNPGDLLYLDPPLDGEES
jgi:DNA-binding Xre family transcriptional regulator